MNKTNFICIPKNMYQLKHLSCTFYCTVEYTEAMMELFITTNVLCYIKLNYNYFEFIKEQNIFISRKLSFNESYYII